MDEHSADDGRIGRIELEATVTLGIRVTDWRALGAAAEAAVARFEFAGENGERQREEMLREVRRDPQAALMALLQPDDLLRDVPGVEAVAGSLEMAPALDLEPDFARLFPLDAPGGGDDRPLLTPRTASLLHDRFGRLADAAYDDIEDHEDEPVRAGEEDDWEILDRLPRTCWQQDAAWRRRMARSFDDLAEDLTEGRWPVPRCRAEEVAVELALDGAAEFLAREPDAVAEMMSDLPAHPLDYSWEACRAVLFRDREQDLILDLPWNEGGERPGGGAGGGMRLDDLRPETWFTAFPEATARDPRRGFRR